MPKHSKRSPLTEIQNAMDASVWLIFHLLSNATAKEQLAMLKEVSTATEWKIAQQLLSPEQRARIISIWGQEKIKGRIPH